VLGWISLVSIAISLPMFWLLWRSYTHMRPAGPAGMGSFDSRNAAPAASSTRSKSSAAPNAKKLDRTENVFLRAAVDRPCVRNGLAVEFLDDLNKWITEFPPLSPVTSRILAELRSPNVDVKAISALIARDPILTAGMLRMANSAAMAQTREVASLDKALSLLGQDAVLAIAMRGAMSGIPVPKGGFDQNQMLRHNVATGLIAGAIAQRVPSVNPADAVTAGLLHDIGKMIMNAAHTSKVADLLNPATTRHGESRLRKEERLFGASHAVIGALLAEHWELPPTLVNAIEMHHLQTIAHETDYSENARTLVAIVFVANQLTKYVRCGGDDDEVDLPSPDILALLNLPDTYVDMLEELEPKVRGTLEAFLTEMPDTAPKKTCDLSEADLAGKVALVPILQLIQMLGATRRTGTLTFRDGGNEAKLAYIEGRLSAAQHNHTLGEEAFYALVEWTDGEFNFVAETPSLPANAAIKYELMPLMMRALHNIDEAHHSAATLAAI